jgi:hypothetical protein
MGVEYGYQLAYHCWDKAGENGDPWPVLAAMVRNPKDLPGDLKRQITGFTDTWKYLASERGEKRLALAKLLARFNITFDQAARWWDPAARNEAGLQIGNDEVTDLSILKNPFVWVSLPIARPTQTGQIERGLLSSLRVIWGMPVRMSESQCLSPNRRVRSDGIMQ